MKTLTLKPNATIIMVFASAQEADQTLSAIGESLPREIASRFKRADSDQGPSITVRIQDISHPVTIALDGSGTSLPAPNVVTGGATNPFARLPADKVPGANAERGTHDAPKTSGQNLTAGVPGAINNDPSTATNAGIEGSPAQAVASAVGNRPAGPTPGGFQGPDKAAEITGAAPGATAPRPSLPKDEKPDAGAVNIQQRAEKEAADGEAAKQSAKASPAKPPKAPLASKVPAPATPAGKPASEPAPATETAKTEESSDKPALASSEAPL